MQKNLVNLALIVAVLIFIFGCVCPSGDDRESGNTDSGTKVKTEDAPGNDRQSNAAGKKTQEDTGETSGGKADQAHHQGHAWYSELHPGQAR